MVGDALLFLFCFSVQVAKPRCRSVSVGEQWLQQNRLQPMSASPSRTHCSFRWAAPSGSLLLVHFFFFGSVIYFIYFPHLCGVVRGQEGPRGGQEMPQSVRSGTQGPVVHRLPLEESLPALPRLKPAKRETKTRMDEWAQKTFIMKRIQIRAWEPSTTIVFFPVCLFYCFRFFLPFLKQRKWSFLYLRIPILKTGVCDGANCWLTLTMWRGKPTILCSKANSAAPRRSTLSDPLSSLFQSPPQWWHNAYDVHYIVCFELSTSILYRFFF